jgi:hypothetical protein
VAEVLVECLGDQARQRNGAAPGGGLGLGSVAAHLGGGFDHLQSVVRQVMGPSGPGGPLPVSEARLWRVGAPRPGGGLIDQVAYRADRVRAGRTIRFGR